MKIRFKNIIILLLFLVLISFSVFSQNSVPVIKKGVLDLRGWNFQIDGNIQLKGAWEFYWQKLYTSESFIDENQIPDAFVDVPGVWTGIKINNSEIPDTGYATYRLIILSDTSYNEGIMIFFKEILTSYRVFFNGRLISTIGIVGTNSQEEIPKVRINKESLTINKGINELIIQISNYSHRTNAFDIEPIIGEEDIVDRAVLKSISFDFMIFGLLMIMAFYHLGLYLFRRKNKIALYFAVFVFVLAVRILITNNFLLPYIFPSLKWEFVYRLAYSCFFIGVPLFILYFQQVFEEKRFKWIFSSIYIISGIFLLTLIFPPLFFTKVLFYYQILTVLIILFIVILLITYLFKKKNGSVILFFSIILIAATVVNDMLYSNDIIKSTTLLPVGLFGLVLGQALTLGRIFTSAFIENEELTNTLEYQNKNLEGIIYERTKELEEQQLNLSEKNEELLVAEEELRQNNEELIILSENLEQNNDELNKATLKLQSQATIGDILRNTTTSILNLNEFLQQTLEIVLQIPWLKLISKGSVFITNSDGYLEMVAQKNLEILEQKCAIIKPEQCLCGRALAEQKIIFTDEITFEHEIDSEDMCPHGHYNIPLILNNEVFGVLNLYVFAGHKSTKFEIEYLETLGSIIASVINRYYLQDDLNKKQQILSEQNIQLESLNIELKKYFAAIEQSSISILITDKNSNIEYANPHFSITTEYSFDEIIGKNPSILNSGNTPRKVFEDLWSTLHAGKVWEGEFINKSKSGREFVEKSIISPIYDDEGNLLNYLAVKEDVTEDRKNERLIKEKNERLEKLNEELQKVLRDILASINYARRIQSALLPSKILSKYILNEHFLIYKPKETVSGDFYFIQEKEQFKFFAVGDCTGHGVPGGFLTMLSITFLKELTLNFNETNPAELLEKFREKMKSVLNVNNSITNDGLDIAFCTFDTQKRILYYAGANMPIFIVRDEELIEFKAVRNPIGNYPFERNFVTHEIVIKENDYLYISSDGYWDQFGTENMKYTINRFKKLLLKINKLPFAEHKDYIVEENNKWQKNCVQIDDITLLGLNLSTL